MNFSGEWEEAKLGKHNDAYQEWLAMGLVDELAAIDQYLVYLMFRENGTYEEIGKKLGISAGRVRDRLEEALDYLQLDFLLEILESTFEKDEEEEDLCDEF